MPSLKEIEVELASVAAKRERLYWAFTRCKNSPPVPAEITRRFYELQKQLATAKKQP